MKEDLGFVGDQLNQINTCFTVGYDLQHLSGIFFRDID